MTKLVNRAKMTTATTGTGTITLGSAVDGYQSFASAGVANGDVVRYVIEDGNNWEIGTGTYTATGTTLSRTVSESSNAGSAIILSGEAVVFVVAAAEEILQESDLTAGTGISIVGSTITNTAPDQTVSLTGSGATSVTGTYPNFTISSTDTNTVPNDATITVSAGTGLTGGGNFTTDQAANETITVSHADTSSQGSVNNSGNTFVQDVTLDGFGHVTGLASATVTLSSLGYTGATNADNYSSWTISDGVNSEAVSSGYTLTVADGGATTASFNPATNTLTISSTDTNTTYSAGGGLSLAGTTFSHTDTSAQGSVNNIGATFIQDVTLDTYGHVTGLGSTTITPATIGAAASSHTHTTSQITDFAEGVQDIIGADVVAGTGISVSYNDTTGDTTITNTAPDQTVSLTGGTNVTVTGTYPNFTISSTDTNTTYSAGTALNLSGTTFNVDLSGLATSITDGDGDFFVVVDSVNAQRKLTKGNINISGFNNDAGYTTNVGDITGVTAGSGLTGGGTSGTVTVSHADTSAQASVNNTGATVIQDVTLDTYGHVTALGSKTLTAADVGAITGNETITLSGDLSGSGTTSINAQIVANAVGANELNVVGNGTTSQYLRSDGDGTFTWATPPDTNTTYSAGNGISLSGTTFSVAAGGGLTQDASGLSHTDTSTQASVNNSGNAVIQDVTLDTYGHVTGLASATIIAPTTNGTTGQVLTSNGTATPTWAAPAGGGAMEFISSTTITTGTTSIDFTGIDTHFTNYAYLILHYTGLTSSVSARVRFLGSDDGGSTWAATASSIVYDVQSNLSTSSSEVRISRSNITSGTYFAGLITIHQDSTDTSRLSFLTDNTMPIISKREIAGGRLDATSTIDAIRLELTTGTLETGVVTLYGAKNS